MSNTPNLALPYWDEGNAQPNLIVNAAWDILDAAITDLEGGGAQMAQPTTNYTPVLGDQVVEMNVGSANELTVPANGDVAFPLGWVLEVWQMGAGQTQIVPDSGVTILYHADDTLFLLGQNAGCSLRKVGTNTWRLVGKMEAA